MGLCGDLATEQPVESVTPNAELARSRLDSGQLVLGNELTKCGAANG